MLINFSELKLKSKKVKKVKITAFRGEGPSACQPVSLSA